MTDTVEILAAKLKVENALLNQTGSYAGVGAQIKEDVVTVYLRNDTEQAKKKAYDLIGSNKANGHEILFVNSGNVVALQCPTSRTEYSRPLCSGVSIGREDIGAGTVGTICYDAVTKEKYLLSNSHVFSGASSYQHPNAMIGDIIYAPGLLDSSGIKYPIGKLNKWIEMDETVSNFVDCATAIPDNTNDIYDDIIGIGRVNGYEEPTEGLLCQKSGRSSGLTEGTIFDYNSSMEVDYGGRIIRFTNCIVTNTMGISGDSGSLMVRKDNKNAVGLLFAGSDTITVFNRISYVMNSLNVTLTIDGTVPEIQYTTSPIDSPEYFVQSLAMTAIGIGTIVGVLPAINEQIQLALHRKFR